MAGLLRGLGLICSDLKPRRPICGVAWYVGHIHLETRCVDQSRSLPTAANDLKHSTWAYAANSCCFYPKALERDGQAPCTSLPARLQIHMVIACQGDQRASGETFLCSSFGRKFAPELRKDPPILLQPQTPKVSRLNSLSFLEPMRPKSERALRPVKATATSLSFGKVASIVSSTRLTRFGFRVACIQK